MDHINTIGVLILVVSSGMLIGYSALAKARGWVQGTFYSSQNAALLGWIAFLTSLILAFNSNGIVGVIVALLVMWLIPGVVLAGLGSAWLFNMTLAPSARPNGHGPYACLNKMLRRLPGQAANR